MRSIVVFSAHAEVVLHSADRGTLWRSILRARGGSSQNLIKMVTMGMYSPRTRR